MTFISAVLVLFLATAAQVLAQDSPGPVANEFSGVTNSIGYTTVSMGKYSLNFRDGTTVTLSSTTPGCYTGCFTDIAPAYPDVTSWIDKPGVCDKLLRDNGEPVVAFMKPETFHMVLYQSIVGQCMYTIRIEGTLCAGWEYGPECEQRKQVPTASFILTPGARYSFEGAYNPERRFPQYSYVVFSFQSTNTATPDQAKLLVAGRTYNEARVVDPKLAVLDGGVWDNATMLDAVGTAQSYTLEVASPARLFSSYSTIQRIPLFWTFQASSNNTDAITVTVSKVDEVECELDLYAGRNCEFFTPYINDGNTYKYSISENGYLSPFLDVVGRANFTIGVMSTNGGVNVLLRYGNVPSEAQFDVAIPVAQADDAQKMLRFYSSSMPVDTTEAPWFVAFYPAEIGKDASFVFWMNTECPSDCSGHGQCINNKCTCDEGFPEPACSSDIGDNPTELPGRVRDMNSTTKFFIVWGVFGGIAVLALWGYLHYRRSTVSSSYSNL